MQDGGKEAEVTKRSPKNVNMSLENARRRPKRCKKGTQDKENETRDDRKEGHGVPGCAQNGSRWRPGMPK